jgi:hypothetical protein
MRPSTVAKNVCPVGLLRFFVRNVRGDLERRICFGIYRRLSPSNGSFWRQI